MQHCGMDDPSVYAKRSFPLSTVNTRQTPRRVTNIVRKSTRHLQKRKSDKSSEVRSPSTNRNLSSEKRDRLSAWSRCDERRTPVDPPIPPLWSSKCSPAPHQLRLIAANGKCTKCRTHHKIMSLINNHHRDSRRSPRKVSASKLLNDKCQLVT